MDRQPLPRHLFVTGTNTGVGKSYVTAHLLRHFAAQGLRVVGMKPVASGCEWIAGVWQNADVAALQAASNVDAPLALRNPYCFDPPIAPHIAAQQAGVRIDIDIIRSAYQQLCQQADVVIVEGAGGLLVPLDANTTLMDLIQALELPALLVVGMQLGCINHALLTAQVLRQSGVTLCGWVANHIDPHMLVADENLDTLRHWLASPPLLTLPFSG